MYSRNSNDHNTRRVLSPGLGESPVLCAVAFGKEGKDDPEVPAGGSGAAAVGRRREERGGILGRCNLSFEPEPSFSSLHHLRMESGPKSEAKQDEEGSSAMGGGGGSSRSSKVYHERQRLQFCLLHALNNLMQVARLSSLSPPVLSCCVLNKRSSIYRLYFFFSREFHITSVPFSYDFLILRGLCH